MILNLQEKSSKVERKQKYKVTRKLFFIFEQIMKKNNMINFIPHLFFVQQQI